MKLPIVTLCLALAAAAAWAQDKKEPSAKQKAQQERMKAKSGAEPSAAQKVQHERMTACNKQATEKKLKGGERKKFMSSCLKS